MFSETFLQDVLKKSLAGGGDYADIFYEETADTAMRYDSGKVKSIDTGTISGAGIRVIYGSNYVYVFSSNITENGLTELAGQISAAVKWDKTGNLGEVKLVSVPVLNPIKIYPDSVEIDKKVECLKRADRASRDYSSKIEEVMIRYWDNDQSVQIATSEGRFVRDRRVRTRFAVSSIAGEGDKKETGMYGPGKSMGFEFLDQYTPEKIAEESARIAVVLLGADYAPQGKLPVIIDNAFGGVIFHEACGHALEATSVADDASVFCGKLDTPIASEIVNAVDDGTIVNGWGSSAVDDEGIETRRNVLIKDGVLKSYMVDKLGSIKMELPITGNSRKQSYKFAPTSRMTNTYIDSGNSSFDEMVASIDNGLYCKNLGGGSVNPPTTDFNFAVNEAYLIKNGKIDRPIKGASLIGKGSEIIRNIEMVGKEIDFGTGMCGSSSGSLPAYVGQPPIKVTGLVVGGQEGGSK